MTLSGFLIGGAVPAVCLGLGTVFMRASCGLAVAMRVQSSTGRHLTDSDGHAATFKRQPSKDVGLFQN